MPQHQPPPSKEESEDFITTLNPNDVLCGRGSGPNDHTGNVRFRSLVAARKYEYLATNNRQVKARIARDVIDKVFNSDPPGRFLRKADIDVVRAQGDKGDAWAIVDEATALEKAKQALRQNSGRKDKGESAGSRGSAASDAASVGTARSSVVSSDETIPTRNVRPESAGTSSSAADGATRMTPQMGALCSGHQRVLPMEHIGGTGYQRVMDPVTQAYGSYLSQGQGGIDEAPFYPGQHPLLDERRGHPYTTGSCREHYGQQGEVQTGEQCRRTLMSRIPAVKSLPDEGQVQDTGSYPRVENLCADESQRGREATSLPLEPVTSLPTAYGCNQINGTERPPYEVPLHGRGSLSRHEPSINESPASLDESMRSIGNIGTVEPMPFNNQRRESGSSFANNSNFSMASMNSSTFSFSKTDSLRSLETGGRQYSGRYLGNLQDSSRGGLSKNNEGGGGPGRLDQLLSKSGGHGYRQHSERFRQDSERFRNDLERYRQDSARYGIPRQDSSRYGVPRQDSDRSYALCQLMTGSSTRKSILSHDKSMSLSEIMSEKRHGQRGSHRASPSSKPTVAEGKERSGGDDRSVECEMHNDGGRKAIVAVDSRSLGMGIVSPASGASMSVSPHHPSPADDLRSIRLLEEVSDNLSFLGHSSMKTFEDSTGSIMKTFGDSSGSSMSGCRTMEDSKSSKCSSTTS